MAKLPIALSVLVLSLAACTTYEPGYVTTPPQPEVRPAAAPLYPVASYRPGYGVVEAIALERFAGARTPSAGAGGTASGTVGHAIDRTGYRLTLRMDDGGMQTIAQDNRDFRVGDRVQLTADGRVVRM